MVKTWSDENVLAILRSKPRFDDASFWATLRGLAGRPTIRSIALPSGVSQSGVGKVLRGLGKDRHARAVYDHLNAQADIRHRLRASGGSGPMGA
ncbi:MULTISPECIES: hypothetical protein [Streptomyces]|uniref:hypothetical protein n=1 Tax=Streptomyces TaxID=1883 RepID=UPI0016727895|nr:MULTISPECIES: hypothetical protein [Streptomyces]MBK3521110.1 hypothetical protein [Streptomyces sp. MBT70]GGR59835.1 hypothetical protein GCM10010236_10730 [Streptomyces eurythermus]